MTSPARRNRRHAAFAAVLLALAGWQGAHAEDIDLFTGLQSNAGTKPNVLLLLDNASTWNAATTIRGCDVPNVVSANNAGTDVGAIQCALYRAVSTLVTNPQLSGNINMGLMMFGTGTNPGGKFRYPSAAPYTLPLMDTANGAQFLEYIKSIDRQADNSNNSQVGGGMQEAWAFFGGRKGLSGTQYASPITNPCQKNFVIYIANAVNNGKPQDTGTEAKDALAAAGASTRQMTQLKLDTTANKYESNWGDEWARFMYETDVNGNLDNNQNIITYTIAVTDGRNPDYVESTRSMADNAGGKRYVVSLGDVDALVQALLQIFNEMQAVNNVFSSVSLPVSVNGQGSYLNQIYIGMFRPDATAAPRWMGNLKQYKLGYDNKNQIVVLDANPSGPNQQSAISNAGTGFISPNAKSFWTAEPPLGFSGSSYTGSQASGWPAKGFWVNSPTGAAGALDSADGVAGVVGGDGEIVEKGGAGEMLRAQFTTDQSGRKLYTCASGACSGKTLASFDTSNGWLTGTSGQAALNTTVADVNNLINWVRGRDVRALSESTIAGAELQKGPGGSVTVRGSVHGDVLHSRPVVINYGGTTGVVVFYGANDGVFHAVNGNQTIGIGGVRPGGELWGFIPPEFYSKLGRLYTNTPEVQLSGSPAGSGAKPRDYFFDGTTTVFQDLRDPAKPRVVIYLTARRGGRLTYALDVTDPMAPEFLWKADSTSIPELGQTWSQPRVIRVKGYANPLVVMGAGYDPAEDAEPSQGGGSSGQGRGVIVFDAFEGNVVRAWLADCTGLSATVCTTPAGMNRAIPSDVAVVDRNGDGLVDKGYVGDVGGNVWRLDFETAAGTGSAAWTLHKFASLGGAQGTNDARKFMYPPDVITTGTYDAVMIGSGDREHPLYTTSTTPGLAYNVSNRFYMLKDTTLTGGLPSTWTALTDADLFNATSTAYADTTAGKGFYLVLGTGEKVVNAPLTVAGYTYFGTNQPSVPKSGACYPDLGKARGYAVSFLTGKGLNNDRHVVFNNGGLPPSPVFGVVAVTDSAGNTSNVPVLIGGGNQTGPGGGDNTSSLGAQKISPPGIGKRKRTYWYTQTDRK
ncbi:pilus assembly protein [Cupriavidus consociatus]|uniref:pilus assembly protein n=1 Tax=Cupriavidus consociatus TaxID=2821357 RepID=UPI001AE6FB20|nr:MULTISPECIES: PilC/PilY family type IV pilus protein [unclassified Cupriavidus]MBP0620083.1 pilus assembly protein PilY [Cupriavidus sp. LEh25]MDK2656738.1 PilC/PilY family type IV pilus protein [Cupriavidus sp. LEh21]